MVDVEGLSLSARLVEGEHVLPAEALPQRMLVDQRFELRDDLRGASRLELGVREILQSGEPQFLEPSCFRLREGLEGEVGEGRSAPHRERVAQRPRTRLAVERARVGDQPLEPGEVDALRVDGQDVAGRSRHDALGAQCLAQRGDAVAERGRGRRGRRVAPELVEQPVGRDDLVDAEEQHRQQRPLFVAAERDDGAKVIERFERAQDPELRDSSFVAGITTVD